MFIRKRFILIILGLVVVLAGFLYYYRQFQSLPEFAMPLLNEVSLPQKDDRVIVFAPHCDDETLGSGMFINRSLANGAKVTVVILTNGDGHRYSTVEEFKKIYPTPQDYIDSGYKRQEESINALGKLGLSKENIIFLGFPDHGLKNMLDSNWTNSYESTFTKKNSSPYSNSYVNKAPYKGEEVQNELTKILADKNPNYIVYPSEFDGHPDHFATNSFVSRALDKVSLTTKAKYTYLVHYSNFPLPRGLKRTRFLTPPAKLIQVQEIWQKLSLTDGQVQVKESAINQYTSQLQSPALKVLMQSFIRKNELFTLVSK
jgi:LmbE family N-acetylglucosaminyl deacetylase